MIRKRGNDMNRTLMIIIAILLVVTTFFEIYDIFMKLRSNKKTKDIFKNNKANQDIYFENSEEKMVICPLNELQGENHGDNLCKIKQDNKIKAYNYNTSGKMFINESGEFI